MSRIADGVDNVWTISLQGMSGQIPSDAVGVDTSRQIDLHGISLNLNQYQTPIPLLGFGLHDMCTIRRL